MGDADRIIRDKTARAGALAGRISPALNNPVAMRAACAGAGASLASLAPRHKPSNWWALEREPWKRVSKEIADTERLHAAALVGFALATGLEAQNK